MTAPHTPVLLAETLAALAVRPGDLYVDATLGAGGYLRAVRAAGAGHCYGFDRDPDALALNADLADAPDVTLIHRPFADLVAGLAAEGVHAVDAIAFDIGVSSMQIDRPERGFSFQSDGPLDMRMAQDGMTAADFINTATEAEIADVLFHLGDEPGARRIARAIVNDRPLTRTSELARLVRSVLGHQPGGKDAATRSFQALRIHVNDELGQLDAGLAAAEQLLRPGGRLAVVSFHSAEDRRVKTFLRDRSGGAPSGSRHMPVVARAAPAFQRPARAVRATPAEVAANPRARSATLRSAVRTATPFAQARSA
ncbi:16S rRNA (cytosine(1402)-N(4))-methyltransferase RsmH [Polymorphobacter fuscus]|uniref:Ribosomal RNA small subunit methyltransferase H n=1 Tax=Sandarakinorhabdus fusca TaxID=1439888 RepID=A0A7C9GQJ6_9SPHN|nr:16S rRNA (cytosine(1402)-N(4))-methyltransferase RsmH [Polymorphobacter fuscus]KAB7644468.1 16S rRNA (cytosine(1402)-N(4))-methyltransferase RsmH [Polymorphobacter fuscus]MQT18395.1 16S rRNA (cytosine(1402)-N(4))-methyltransferase RsmH [Polymorphobacter fuscus]NJC08295.1 16S rRNA (cytosine1402-N4)-methyltransferase [Polymorphobacter fuscus]